jgi:hypothetical protein
VANVEDSIDAYRVLVGRSVDGRIIRVAWNGLMCFRVGRGAGCCECGEFHDWLSICCLLKKVSAQWS